MKLDLGIKPYYSTDRGDLYHADCLDLLPKIPDKVVDLCLTDPPYGKQWSRGVNAIGVLKDKNEKVDAVKWDTDIPTKEVFNLILQYQAIIFGGNYFTDYLPPSNCWIVWDKLGNLKLGEQIPFADCELAWTSFKSVVKKYTIRQQGFIKDTKDDRIHPTQKPSELFKLILQDYSKENNLILDPFSGSGTTAVACEDLRRRWICIEKEERYCQLSATRIENFLKQGKLF